VFLLSDFRQISLRMTRWSSRSTTFSRSFVHHVRGPYLTVNEDGVPVIVAVPCPNERVAAMELLDPESVLEGTPTTYWSVRSDQAVDGKTYRLPINNQPPAAFDLVVRLAGDLPADIPLVVDVRTLSNEGDPSGAAREFRIEDLRVGEVLARGHQLVSLDEFMTSARDAC
jgi:hypothetical protein